MPGRIVVTKQFPQRKRRFFKSVSFFINLCSTECCFVSVMDLHGHLQIREAGSS